MLYICIFSNKFDLKLTIRVLHKWYSDTSPFSIPCQNLLL
jgi:hypothetical protein